MTKREIMIKAHKMTKEIKNEYPEVDYKFQLGLCLAYLQEEGENEMITYKTKNGAKIEIRLEGTLVTDLIVKGIEIVKNNKSSNTVFVTSFDNTIVLNDSYAYKKLGSKCPIRIKANDELITKFEEAVRKKIDKENEQFRKCSEGFKNYLKKNNINEEAYLTSFNKFMNDKNCLI